jgi:hypothetical protein
MADVAYFFTVYDNNQNPIPGISGTWSLYCAEDRFTPPSEGVLITSQSFTTGQNGGVEYNSGNPISVDSKYTDFGIVLKVDGYRTGFSTQAIEENSGSVPTDSSLEIVIVTENQYIQEKIDNLKNILSNRVIPA